MRAEVTRLDLLARRRSTIGYSLGTALYSLVVVALYPAFKGSTSLDKLVQTDSTAAALFGVSGSITSSGGWLDANIYANFLPLLMLLMTVGYGAAAIAGQDEDGTLCLIATLPRSRRAVVVQKAAAMAVQAGALAAAVAACVCAGRAFEVSVPATDVFEVSAAVGAARGRRGAAIAVAAVVAAASYLVSSLAPAVSWIRPARYASLFYWSVGRDQITSGLGAGDAAVLVGAGAAALWATALLFDRLDVH